MKLDKNVAIIRCDDYVTNGVATLLFDFILSARRRCFLGSDPEEEEEEEAELHQLHRRHPAPHSGDRPSVRNHTRPGSIKPERLGSAGCTLLNSFIYLFLTTWIYFYLF